MNGRHKCRPYRIVGVRFIEPVIEYIEWVNLSGISGCN